MTLPDSTSNGLEPSASRCLERTRSVVLNVMIVDGLAIAATGLLLRRWEGIETDLDRGLLKKVLLGGLFGLFAFAMLVLRQLGGRRRLEPPTTRARRYFTSRVGTAVLGWCALPLGLAYGILIDPSLGGVAPFWLGAMVLGRLALPRAIDLEGFDEPMNDEAEVPR
ncbi:hypothetical protein [Paludisphaera rhizosphaerae]|uniref:hypothetical protein n=1 Tax=Paludisphaera rhizosphaerae TaxID=2711216 RepID=UPI0013EABC55|nr:hypothetical protein [Paludisphaera rhizosphaerae]